MSGEGMGDGAAELADLVGVAAGYTDAYGNHVTTALSARRRVLSGLGLATDTEADVRAGLDRARALRRGLVAPLLPVEARRPSRVPLRDGMGPIAWTLIDERGAAREGRAEGTAGREGAAGFDLPPLTPGYHRLHVRAGEARAEATVIAAPRRCWRPAPYAEASGGARDWGLAAQLYGLRSAYNLGIGTYRDAGEAAEEAGALGASFLGLSPVHALFATDRAKISPYSPSSRLALEPLHVDPAIVPGFAGGEGARRYEARAAEIAHLRDAPLVEHWDVWTALVDVLEGIWLDSPARRGEDPAFAAFRVGAGEAVESHAVFEALSEHFRGRGAHWLGEWPEAYRRAGTQEVRRFAAEHAERVAFHAWLQWLSDTQLGEAAARARTAGMRLGLYRDLAVGADRGGSEVWAHPERFAADLSIGAPPDLLAPNGQDWGLPPFDPLALERDGLAAFRALVQANMRHAGAIRIDHAFQLRRLFLIPGDGTAHDGAYVDMPFEPMLAVLRLESHRARCLVIAEDLGTAPDGFSDAIMGAGMQSYRVLSFERGPDLAFKPPGEYPRDALAAISTHDLPTFVGWWRGLDTDLRQTLGLYDTERAERERAERVIERRRLAEALHDEGLLASGEPPETAPFEAAARYLARTPCALVAIQYEDVVGELSQANMPGTTEGYPSWRRKLPLDLAAIGAPGGPLARLSAALAEEGRGPRTGVGRLASPPPRATYRLQFHKDFTFADGARVAPYLAGLGISHVYASPIQRARPGSTHGYDIVDHTVFNPELGGDEGFVAFSDALRANGLKLLLDIVPNHMGVGGADNPWWLDLLEWGALAPNAGAFDVDWERLGAHGRLVVPFLGDRYGGALEAGNLRLAYEADEGAFSVWHYEHRLPVCPLQYPIVLDRALAALGDLGEEGAAEMLAVSERLRRMEEETVPERRVGFPAEAAELKGRLAASVENSPALRAAIDRAVALVNGVPGRPETFGTLHRILEAQAYRLAHWRVAASDINYRRFFDVNGLAGLRVERAEVFARAHETVFRHVREGRIDGLRIDHIDGLADPAGYARALQDAVGPGTYVVVEKILEPGEKLRPWPIAGTTGYDALNEIDGLFVEPRNGPTLERLYRAAAGMDGRYERLLLGAKTEILESSFASELEVLTSDLKRLADSDRRTRDFSVNAIRRALSEIIARFPVYRSYLPADLDPGEVEPDDRRLVEETVEAAKRRSSLPDRSVHDFAADALLGRIVTEGPGRPDPALVRRFRRRFQQITGPVMAKSLEDTLFYRYSRLISLNEVGGDPGHFGGDPAAFHSAQGARARDWPNAMIATATHDTKRGEDARARLNALSEMPDALAEAWERWRTVAGPHLSTRDGAAEPDANDQWMLLQAILGAWPLELLGEEAKGADVEAFRTRLEAYAEKALRESKRHTSWVNVDEAYEDATRRLLGALVAPGAPFLEAFRPLARRLARSGLVNGLARTALKCTLPGLPDTYQGTEFWDFSLVDPDNRRPVDYAERATALADAETGAAALLARWPDGAVKQRLLARLLADRAAHAAFYAGADYAPLAGEADGGRLLAFARLTGEEAIVVAVPRLASDRLADDAAWPLGPALWSAGAWDEARLAPPRPGTWRDVVTGATFAVPEGGSLAARDLFSALPVAVLRRSADA